jgi:hypothetical protein
MIPLLSYGHNLARPFPQIFSWTTQDPLINLSLKMVYRVGAIRWKDPPHRKGFIMKKLVLISLILALILSVFALPALAQTKGRGIGAQVHDGKWGFELRKDIPLGGDISQVTGQLGMVFPKSNAWLTFDFDYHWNINTDSGTSRFYPLAGIGFKTDFDNFKFGINGGGGANFMLTDKTAAFVEAKYVFTGWDGFAVAFGVYF